MKTPALMLTALVALSAPAFAQESGFELPQQCRPAMDHAGHHGHGDHAPMAGMEGDYADMPEHVQENMRRMAVTMPAMHEGMMIENPDVAFACGMIAHHQGAIDMAEVLLEHGSDDQMRALAEEIIAAQVEEIEVMTTWLAENAE